MKAITVRQPHASLVAMGVQRMVTTSWPTKHRGRLVLHAAARPPEVEMMEDGPAGEITDGDGEVLAQWAYTPPMDFVPGKVPPTNLRWWLATREHNMLPETMPLGFVVATCELVDCAPVGGSHDFSTGLYEGAAPDYAGHTVVVHHEALGSMAEELVVDDPAHGAALANDQLPFDNFAPGRYAWVLDDVRPVEERCPACWGFGSYPHLTRMLCRLCWGKLKVGPVPATGKRWLWDWEPPGRMGQLPPSSAD